MGGDRAASAFNNVLLESFPLDLFRPNSGRAEATPRGSSGSVHCGKVYFGIFRVYFIVYFVFSEGIFRVYFGRSPNRNSCIRYISGIFHSIFRTS